MSQREDARMNYSGDRIRSRARTSYRMNQASSRAQVWGWFDLFIVIILILLVATLVR